VRVIEGVLVVEEIHDSAARTAGVAVGDVVVAVDGEPALARLQRLGKYVAASHEVAHRLYVAGQMLGGAEGSMAALTLRGADGRDRSVRLARTMTGAPSPHRGGEVVQVLPRNVGYIDLERLEPGGVSAALERIKATRGLVLDLRGYPKITTWELAARLNITRAPWAAAFQRPLVGGEAALEGDGGARLSFMQPLPPPRGWVYDKPVVTLIDERAISRAEHTALFLETACHPRFVGSPTAGANGDVTTFTLPGGLRVWFTGHDVRHADGRQLQRVGIQPHVAVTPTIAGLRAGRDEVLERAVREIP
jgi:C-terminal processing protease CtpA/Prc